MGKMMGWACTAVLAALLAGCATTGGGGTPCEQCNYGWTNVLKRPDRQVWCFIDGKKVDCMKNPPECPECAKKAQERK